MTEIKWEPDPSPLQMLESGESSSIESVISKSGHWKLRIDKLVPLNLGGGLLGSLSEKEKNVLNMRFGLDGERDHDAEAKREKRKEREKNYPFIWKVEFESEHYLSGFTHMGGRAKTKEIAKQMAIEAVECAEYTLKKLG